jgi:lipoprotein-releasing system permease protein
VEATDGVVATCPKVSGSALAYRGAAEEAVKVVGADADRLRQIVDLRANLVDGTYRLGGDEAVIGTTLAEKLGARTGDPIRVRSADRESVLRIAGIFDVGSEMVNGRWVVTSLRNAQTLLGRIGDITEIDVRVAEVYEAEGIAREIEAMIRIFVLLAVAMGIASVLSVTVVQRRGQIGILRAVGTSRRIVLAVFLWQGLLFGLVGALLGTGVGAVAGELIEASALFDITVTPRLLFTALTVSTCRRAGPRTWTQRRPFEATNDARARVLAVGGHPQVVRGWRQDGGSPRHRHLDRRRRPRGTSRAIGLREKHLAESDRASRPAHARPHLD